MAAPQTDLGGYLLYRRIVRADVTGNQPPVIRHHGRMRRLDTKTLDSDDTTALMKSITPDRCQQELQENPVLELKEASDDQPVGEEEAEAAPAVETPENNEREEELVIDDTGDNSIDFDRLEALSKDWEDQFNEEHRPSRNGMDEEGDKKHDAMQNMASRPQSLQEYLRARQRE